MDRYYFEAPYYYEPRPGDPPAVFLAGGITHCPPWQPHAANLLRDFTVFNPRANFPIHDPAQPSIQIEWEYRHLQMGDVIIFWFPACDAALTTQPITMYKLGAAAAGGRRMVVGVDPGYPLVADVRTQLGPVRPELTVHATLDGTLEAARTVLGQLPRRGCHTGTGAPHCASCGHQGDITEDRPGGGHAERRRRLTPAQHAEITGAPEATAQ